MEPGEYAVRGGILDLFPPGRSTPGAARFLRRHAGEHQGVRSRDAAHGARSCSKLDPDADQRGRLRRGGRALFRAPLRRDCSAARPATTRSTRRSAPASAIPGMEHWLPLFHEQLETLFDYVPGAAVSFDHLADEAVERAASSRSRSTTRRASKALEAADASARRPTSRCRPTAMFLDARGRGRAALAAPRDRAPDALRGGREAGAPCARWRGRGGRNFAAERASERASTCSTPSSRHIRAPAGPGQARHRRRLDAGRARAAGDAARRARPQGRRARSRATPRRWRCPRRRPALAVLGLEQGFETPDLAVIGEQDILGDRLVRPRRKARRAADVLTEATSLSVGDLVVHADHGIGRFDGLKTITALGAPHDCLELDYAGGDKLYLPVENIELLSRYGSDEARCATRPARRRRLADAQGPPQEAPARDRRRADQDRGAAPAASEAPALAPPAGRLRRVRRPLPLRGDRGSGGQHRRRARRPRLRAGRWTGWCAATSASARPRSRCAPPSSPP